jgi:nicotinamidase-related amidase
MKHIKVLNPIGILLLALAADPAEAQPRAIRLALQTRDPKTNEIQTRTEEVDSAKVAVVIVDPWNYHWCMTACERLSAMVPRWNRAIEGARKLGMPILWVPSDVLGSYSGYPQRERALGVPLLPVPKLSDMPPARFTAPGGGCMCGPGIACAANYGFDGMNPDLILAEDDLIASSTEEVYALLKQRGITHVIYLGLHTNMCLFGKPGALKYMVQAGLSCMLARDINDAFTSYNPATGFTPDKGTQQTDEDLERAGVPTINVVEEWRKAGVWNDDWIVETVRITPWGKTQRPYFFEPSVTVTLTTPWLRDVEIRYTLDGSEPNAASPLYEKPLLLSETKSLRTAAFQSGKLVSVPTDAHFARLPPRPPKPDVYLDDLKYILDPYGQIAPVFAACLWQPKLGKSYEGQALRVRGKVYAKGLGFRAPSAVRYELKPEYDRFVALAGIADNMLDHELGRNLAMHCSVVFRAFIDGQLAAESPVMRISQEPWRFDVKIPPGSRFINLVCMDAGSRNVLDLGNWIEAGFVLKEGEAKARVRAAREHGAWKAMRVPGYWEQAPGGEWATYDGTAWYRCYVKTPPTWASQDVTLHIERLDNWHTTFVNGRKVGEGVLDQSDYCRATLKGNDLRLGAYNLVAIRVEDVGGAGGFAGLSPVLYCGDEAIELKGDWEFRTGDDAAWAQWPAGAQPPGFARFEKVVPAALVPRPAGATK